MTSSPSAIAAATPMLRQYLEVKARHPDALLFFRLGDFYELFFEDAKTAAGLLDLTLTSRPKGEERIPMCGVPYHAAHGYIARLVETGHKVAVCDQLSVPDGKSIVRREVTRVVTPGTVLDENVLQARANNFLVAVCPLPGGGALAALDASTGEFRCAEISTAEAFADELSRLGAREVLAPRGAQADPSLAAALARSPRSARAPVDWREDQEFDPRRGVAALTSHFGVASLDGFGLAGFGPALGAAAAALAYAKATQQSALAHVDRLAPYRRTDALVLDAQVLGNLEVLRGQDGKRSGSLLGLLDRTATAMGARRLARWLAEPLLDPAAIGERLDAVEELFTQGVLRADLADLLKGVHDLERLTARLGAAQGGPRDLAALAASLLRLPAVAERMAGVTARVLRGIAEELSSPPTLALPPKGGGEGRGGTAGPSDAIQDLAHHLARAVADTPPVLARDGGFVRQGYSPELDELRAISTGGKDAILAIEAREKARTGIGSLKVRFNKVFGYSIEITRANLDRVPPDYERRQTMAGGERFVTPELRAYEEKVLTSEERQVVLELEIFEKLRALVVESAPAIRAVAERAGALDALVSLARAAADHGYVRPEVDSSEALEIADGRHPVVERALPGGEPFVPNDVVLSCAERQLLVLTGPNMAGKSTVMRQAALIALMAQAGSFVPARSARIGVVDRIFTRVGASDDLARGRSTFMVEMTETAQILHAATRRSLVLLDEIGRGTSTFDGLSIAWAVCEFIHDQVGCRTLFATHYHELCELAKDRPRVVNLTMAVKEWEDRVIFLRKLVPGAANRSYGIQVARLAGLPREVLGRAREILAGLEKAEIDDTGHAVFARGGKRKAPPTDQLGLFAPPRPSAVEEELKALALDTLTPIEALNWIARWKERLR